MKYLRYSLVIHLFAFLLLMSFVKLPQSTMKRYQSVILVNFQEPTISESSLTLKQQNKQVQKPVTPTLSTKPVALASSNSKVKSDVLNKSPQTSKPAKAQTSKTDTKSRITNEKAALQAQIDQEKAIQKEKSASFAHLLNNTKTRELKDHTTQANDHGYITTDAQEFAKLGTIQEGSLSGRRVIFVPTIRDHSQKQGRIVVRICVGPTGEVLLSKYTQIGSTSTDPYLIKLAEEGAARYRFSESDHPKECGQVTIDFKLRA